MLHPVGIVLDRKLGMDATGVEVAQALIEDLVEACEVESFGTALVFPLEEGADWPVFSVSH